MVGTRFGEGQRGDRSKPVEAAFHSVCPANSCSATQLRSFPQLSIAGSTAAQEQLRFLAPSIWWHDYRWPLYLHGRTWLLLQKCPSLCHRFSSVRNGCAPYAWLQAWMQRILRRRMKFQRNGSRRSVSGAVRRTSHNPPSTTELQTPKVPVLWRACSASA